MDLTKFEEGRRVCMAGSPEGLYFTITEKEFVLVFRYKSPTISEVRQIRRDVIQLRFLEDEGLLIFLVRTGMSPWQRGVFHKGCCAVKTISRPDFHRGIPIWVMLVDADTGALMVKRVLELTHGFSDRMVDIIERQPEDPPKNWDMIQRRVLKKNSIIQMIALAGIK